MSDPDKAAGPHSSSDEPEGAVNLILVYSLIATALFVAIGIALFIVLPFYHRRG